MRPVTFVSTNEGKVREVRAVLAEHGITVRWRRRELPEPQADTLEEVVRAKLSALGPSRGLFLVEDSGLFVRALGGFPGVYSAYVLRTIGLEGLLRLVTGRDRAAIFRTVAGVRDGRRSWTVSGASYGELTTARKGVGGFGYDPVFRPRGSRRTFAEMTIEEKNRQSHRARALRRVARRLAPPSVRQM